MGKGTPHVSRSSSSSVHIPKAKCNDRLPEYLDDSVKSLNPLTYRKVSSEQFVVIRKLEHARNRAMSLNDHVLVMRQSDAQLYHVQSSYLKGIPMTPGQKFTAHYGISRNPAGIELETLIIDKEE